MQRQRQKSSSKGFTSVADVSGRTSLFSMNESVGAPPEGEGNVFQFGAGGGSEGSAGGSSSSSPVDLDIHGNLPGVFRKKTTLHV